MPVNIIYLSNIRQTIIINLKPHKVVCKIRLLYYNENEIALESFVGNLSSVEHEYTALGL